ncbi:hypothetical protein [Marinibactrum halimedae]|uniref:EF-hand domain-containing protein n=1 Tax=Marinibactrum halimedae TaxID=1444977 RepID=A0AA37WLD9_9GAMM|nr:hypothetical protein [Marinibactrum halimedae]MCD9458725.1 hypothetical protein [Marinibactrum halimedae]GLS25909.1 hypothetical protein GCM10007877_16240 [Marinibactrum halimedae]
MTDSLEHLKYLSSNISDAMLFESNDEDEEYQVNKNSKIKVLDFILDEHDKTNDNSISKEQFNIVFLKSLELLQANTGCAEDLEILEDILDVLYDKGLIDKEKYKNIIEGSPCGRWL